MSVAGMRLLQEPATGAGGGDRDAGDAALRDQLDHQARRLHLFHERAEILGGDGPVLRRSDRLLDTGKLAVEQTGSGQLGDLDEQLRAEAGERFQLVGDE